MPSSSSGSPLAAIAAREIAEFRRKHPTATQVDILIADACGVFRGKKIPVAKLEGLYRDGVGFPGSLYATDITGETVDATGLGFDDGDADRICLPILNTLDGVPWADRPSGQIMVAMQDFDGSPFFADPRRVLAGVVERLSADGLTPVVAIELEFYLIDRDRDPAGRPRPPLSPLHGRRQNTVQVYGIGELYDFDTLLNEVYDACREQEIPVDSVVSEYAPGQYEINLHHVRDPLEACEDALLFKRAVKNVAVKHGIDATFMAKPYPDRAGSGFHIHLSLLDRDGRNVFAGDDPMGSAALRHAIGGLSATMADGMALFAQNQNAFRRFQPNSYAPHAPSWGVNNRTVSLRIPAGQPADRRVEHRVAGADANPYLVMAAVLAGAHHGLTHTLDPGPPTTGNAYRKVDPTLTSSWIVALDLLDQSGVFEDYLGRPFLDVYLALKRAEREKFFATITPLEYDWYLNRV